MLIFLNIAIIVTLALARPEPPVNSYLPPSAAGNDGNISFLSSSGVYRGLDIEGSRSDGGINSPLSNYGPSDLERSSFNNGGRRPASTYGALLSGSGNNNARGDAGGFASTYGAPSNNNVANRQSPSRFRGDSSAYGTPSFDKSNRSGGTTSSTYRAFGGSIGSGGRTSSSYVAGREEFSSFSDSGNGSGRELSSIYGAPAFSGSDKRFGKPSSTYDASRRISGDRSGNNIHSATYRAPGVGGNRPADSYGPPASGTTGYTRGNDGERRRSTFGDKRNGSVGTEDNREPAKYEFSYQVEDPPSSLSFGHSEMRDGDYTTGQYNVLLPDGRKQIVEYEADKDGYRPQIRYEGGNYQRRFGSTGGRTGGYSYDQSEGSGGESSGITIGQDFVTNGYSNGRTNEGRNGSARVRSDQNLGSNSYSNGTPKSFGGNGGGNSGQYNNKGQGYSSGHPNDNNGNGDGGGYHNEGYQIGGGGGNGYDYERQGNFEPDRSNGDNNASGYRY